MTKFLRLLVDNVSYPNKTILKAYDTKFFRLLVDSTLYWKLHIEQVLHMLSAACYVLRSTKPYMFSMHTFC
jgi:hypothetical protein